MAVEALCHIFVRGVEALNGVWLGGAQSGAWKDWRVSWKRQRSGKCRGREMDREFSGRSKRHLQPVTSRVHQTVVTDNVGLG